MRLFIAAVIALPLAACMGTPAEQMKPSASVNSKAEADLRASLRDPSSGEFRNFRSFKLANGETAVCAEVNARNGFGGMTGWRDMLVNYSSSRAPLLWADDLAAYECANLAGGTSAR